MYLIFWDIETTGDNLEKNAMVEIGAVCVDVDTNNILGTYHAYLSVPENRCWDERCLREFWEKDDYMKARKAIILEEGRDPEIVMNEFVLWCNNMNTSYQILDDDDKLRFSGDAVYFDASWMNMYLSKYTATTSLQLLFTDDKNIPDFRPLFQTSDYYKGLAGASPKQWGSDKMVLKLYGISEDEIKNKHNHNALSDAMHIAEIFHRVWVRQNESISLRVSCLQCNSTISSFIDSVAKFGVISFAIIIPYLIGTRYDMF